MSLSCSCGEWDGEGIGFYEPTDFVKLKSKQRKRCKSCAGLIDVGSDCLRWDRMRHPQTEVEIKILGEDAEVFLAPYYFCEDCGCIYLSLNELGFCLDPTDEMSEMLREYQEDYAHPAWESFRNA